MFSGCKSLLFVSEMRANAAKLSSYCFSSMYEDCIHLIKAYDELDNNSSSGYIYNRMFANCIELLKAPYINIDYKNKSIGESCYSYMFFHCISLTDVQPQLSLISTSKNLL